MGFTCVSWYRVRYSRDQATMSDGIPSVEPCNSLFLTSQIFHQLTKASKSKSWHSKRFKVLYMVHTELWAYKLGKVKWSTTPDIAEPATLHKNMEAGLQYQTTVSAVGRGGDVASEEFHRDWENMFASSLNEQMDSWRKMELPDFLPFNALFATRSSPVMRLSLHRQLVSRFDRELPVFGVVPHDFVLEINCTNRNGEDALTVHMPKGCFNEGSIPCTRLRVNNICYLVQVKTRRRPWSEEPEICIIWDPRTIPNGCRILITDANAKTLCQESPSFEDTRPSRPWSGSKWCIQEGPRGVISSLKNPCYQGVGVGEESPTLLGQQRQIEGIKITKSQPSQTFGSTQLFKSSKSIYNI